jgi:4-alpha-glucanotransferase
MSGRRRSGLLIPLFSAPSSESWGIGDISDIARLCGWLAGAGQRILQLLPLNEMASGGQSPYSAMSAMAIDPIYIDVSRVPEFARGGGEASLESAARDALQHARHHPRVDYAAVRRVKREALSAAFDRFFVDEWSAATPRADELRAYVYAQSWWLVDYGLFRAIHDREDGRSWTTWPDALRDRDPSALDDARRTLAREVLFYQYLQWLAGTQWQDARRTAATHGVALFGDLPFMVDTHSADVWQHQQHFRLDRSVGVPPDAFSATGQDWGMPAYNWASLERSGFGWLHDRARRSADLYDGYRVDHLVGFYRTYSRPRSGDGDAAFEPADERDQVALGEQVLRIFGEAGSAIVAEDLGTVPDFVRASLARLGVPGFRVFRWEREWNSAGQPFRDPAEYPESSVATSGTHDTEPAIVWWESASEAERAAVAQLPTVRALAGDIDLVHGPYDARVRDVLVEALFASKSEMLLFPIQDVFGWRDRINEPATVGPDNWTYRLPWPVDRLADQAAAQERQAALRTWTERHGR